MKICSFSYLPWYFQVYQVWIQSEMVGFFHWFTWRGMTHMLAVNEIFFCQELTTVNWNFIECTWLFCSVMLRKKRRAYNCRFPPQLLDVVSQSEVFLYPLLLPPQPFRCDGFAKPFYFQSEDVWVTTQLILQNFPHETVLNPFAYTYGWEPVWATDVFAFSCSFLSVDGMTCRISF
jgi:hypothetical protein